MTTTPDTPSLPETIVPALTQAIGQILRRLRQEANPGGFNISQIAVLSQLDESGPMTSADLARTLAMTPQSMGAILTGLEGWGLVGRAPHPRDGRQILFSLSERGREARRSRHMAKQDWLLAAIGALDPDAQRTLLAAAAILKDLSKP